MCLPENQTVQGIVLDNSVIDNQVYDVNDNLTSARIRHYSTKANAQAAGDTGLLNTWTISASYTGTYLNNFIMTREGS